MLRYPNNHSSPTLISPISIYNNTLDTVTVLVTMLHKHPLKGINILIKSFRDKWLEAYFVGDIRTKKIPANIDVRLYRKLQLIDDAEKDLDLRIPPSNHFEKLIGRLNGKHSIRVNKQWRLIFHWDNSEGKAINIYLDKHEYR